MFSVAIYLILDPPHILVLSLLLQRAFILVESTTRAIKSRIMDRTAFIVIEIFKDSWKIYCGQLTHAQLCRNIGKNVKKALFLIEV
jgi:hypothetical protein